MLKVCVIMLILLVPVCASAERIYGQTTRTYDGGSYTDLRSSDGSTATITVQPKGEIDIHTTRSTEQFIGDLERSTENTRRAIESLNDDHN